MQELDGKTCQLCEEEIKVNEEGDPFVACNECAFPVCRNCYEYERREGNKVCPQCKTRFKRLKGMHIYIYTISFNNYNSPLEIFSPI